MKKSIKCIILLLSVFIIVNPVFAATHLISAPLSRGSNGDFRCSCVNISKKDMTFEILVSYAYEGTVGAVKNGTISPGEVLTKSTVANSPPVVAYCEVQPYSGKVTLTTKTVLCTFSLIDINGNPQITLPVNTKISR